MKFIVNNFSLNMILISENYSLDVEFIDLAEFKDECASAKNRLSKMDICQELDLFPQKGNVAASIGDVLLVAQYLDKELVCRRITVKGADTC